MIRPIYIEIKNDTDEDIVTNYITRLQWHDIAVYIAPGITNKTLFQIEEELENK